MTATTPTKGHRRALAMLEDAVACRTTIAMYERELGASSVYLRLTGTGFTVMSLDQKQSSMVGVGGRSSGSCTIKSLPPGEEDVRRACALYRGKIATLKRPSKEERFAILLIGGALMEGLSLPRAGTSFIHQEWKLPSGKKVDLLGIEPGQGRLVVVELKASEKEARQVDARKGGTAWDQARGYSDELHAGRADFYPFFERVARAMAQIYGGHDDLRRVTLDRSRPPATAVAWPGCGRDAWQR